MKQTLIWLGAILLVAFVVRQLPHRINSLPVRKSPFGEHHLEVGGLDREYWVFGTEGRSLPVVIALHGGGGPLGSAELMRDRSGWVELSQKEGFLAVFPQGTIVDPSKPLNLENDPKKDYNIRDWNEGSGITAASKKGVDDVGFIRSVIEDLSRHFDIDQKRIYVTGFSNGATMSYRLGVELSSEVAAITPVAGVLYTLKPLQSPVSLLNIVGGKDPSPSSVSSNPMVVDRVRVWSKSLGCSQEKIALSTNQFQETLFSPCKGGEVENFRIANLGHVYPGLSVLFGADPKVGDSVNATMMAWEFFKNHPKVSN